MNDIAGLMVAFLISFGGLLYYTYDNLEYKGYSRAQSCTGECYEEYVRTHGTTIDILKAKQELANADEFSSIRSLWAGCAACHGNEGQGMAVFPALKGQTADYIIDRLTTYKNRGEVGAMSSTMWAQAGQLSEQDIETLGKFIEVELK
tara:strand:+ start:211 stop:654 length:444 start_codon:yes stop_codon:yes gene_type:complete